MRAEGKILPALSLNMVTNNIMLTAVQWNKMCGTRTHGKLELQRVQCSLPLMQKRSQCISDARRPVKQWPCLSNANKIHSLGNTHTLLFYVIFHSYFFGSAWAIIRELRFNVELDRSHPVVWHYTHIYFYTSYTTLIKLTILSATT